jgi:hypothetical protein
MYGELDLEEVSKKCKSPERASDFYEFWNEEILFKMQFINL